MVCFPIVHCEVPRDYLCDSVEDAMGLRQSKRSLEPDELREDAGRKDIHSQQRELIV